MKRLESGRYDDISLKDYHGEIEGFSKSSLDLIDRSYSHYEYAKQNPQEDTPSLLVGSAFHCKVLTPELFFSEFFVYPDEKIDGRTKEGKARRKELELDAGGKRILTAQQYNLVCDMEKSIWRHNVVSELLKNGSAEHTFIWTDPKTGLKCKCRPDYIRDDERWIIDLKTTQDASYFPFQKSFYSYRIHVQSAFYLDGVTEIIKRRYESFIIIAIEKQPPYEIAIYNADKDAIDLGRVSYEENLKTAKQAIDNPENHKGYSLEVQDMVLPRWAT